MIQRPLRLTVMEECMHACARACVCDDGDSQHQSQSQIWECGNETEGWQTNKV